jgi:hypothetical protein
MKPSPCKKFGPLAVIALAGLLPAATTGCQSTIAGQTLPSAYYLRDDVQYFPAGSEFKLTNQVQALEEYRLDQEALDAGF